MGASASTAMPKGKQARFVWKDIAQRTDLTALQQTRASEQALEIAVDQSSRLKALIESYLVEMRKREKETGIKAPEGSQLSRWADEIGKCTRIKITRYLDQLLTSKSYFCRRSLF